jgi:hypothetical protein
MAYRSGTKVDYALTSATPSVTVPSGAATNDIALIDLWCETSVAVTTPPSGFALDATASPGSGRSTNIRRYWKRLTGADTGSYSFTLASSVNCMFVCTLFSGRITSGSPFDVTSDVSVQNPIADLSLTTSTAGCDLMVSIGTWDTSWNTSFLPAGGWTARSPADYVWAYGRDNVSAGTYSGNPTSPPNDSYVGIYSALKPDGGGGGPASPYGFWMPPPRRIRTR